MSVELQTTENGTTPTHVSEVHRREVRPEVDILKSDDGLIIIADMPGVREDSVEVTIEQNVLTLTGRLPEAHHREAAGSSYAESQVADFKRSFRLGRDLDSEAIEATVNDGVLRLRIPHSAAQKPRRINVTH